MCPGEEVNPVLVGFSVFPTSGERCESLAPRHTSPASLPLGLHHAGAHGVSGKRAGGRHDHRLLASLCPPAGSEEAGPGAGGRKLHPPGVPGEGEQTGSGARDGRKR